MVECSDSSSHGVKVSEMEMELVHLKSGRTPVVSMGESELRSVIMESPVGHC